MIDHISLSYFMYYEPQSFIIQETPQVYTIFGLFLMLFISKYLKAFLNKQKSLFEKN